MGGSVGADFRAATSLEVEVAAQERYSHIKTALSWKPSSGGKGAWKNRASRQFVHVRL